MRFRRFKGRRRLRFRLLRTNIAGDKPNNVKHGGIGLAAGKTGAEGHAGWIRTNQGVATCITLVVVALLVYIGSSDWPYQKLRDGFRLGFFTVISVIAMLVCAVAMMVDRQRKHTEDDMARSGWLDWIVAGGAMVLCYIYFELGLLPDTTFATRRILGRHFRAVALQHDAVKVTKFRRIEIEGRLM